MSAMLLRLGLGLRVRFRVGTRVASSHHCLLKDSLPSCVASTQVRDRAMPQLRAMIHIRVRVRIQIRLRAMIESAATRVMMGVRLA